MMSKKNKECQGRDSEQLPFVVSNHLLRSSISRAVIGKIRWFEWLDLGNNTYSRGQPVHGGNRISVVH